MLGCTLLALSMPLGEGKPRSNSKSNVSLVSIAGIVPSDPDHLLAAPPKYFLETDYIEAEVGSSPTLAFTVSSDPSLAGDTEHILNKRGGGEVTRRFKVERNCITFRKLRVEDSGMYTISCCSEEGEVGQATLELEVTYPPPPAHQPAHSQGNTQTGIKGMF